MSEVESLDHLVIHVSDWERANRFYGEILGAELVDNPEGADNPFGPKAFRFGSQQLNVHGPWPGRSEPCCPPPLNKPGAADLCFAWSGSVEEARAHLEQHGVQVIAGPVRRFGARGWGQSVYCEDPDGSSVELICYE